MPQLPPDFPEAVPFEVARAFRDHPDLLDICGEPVRAQLGNGLSNRVFRLEAGRGRFFLRLPLQEQAVQVDRAAEAHNLDLAAALGLALPPLYCNVDASILVTSAVSVLDPSPADLPQQLGRALGRLHDAACSFQGTIDPDALINGQRNRLQGAGALVARVDDLLVLLEKTAARLGFQNNLRPVPSHGDPSPGNCLATAERFWLIDWEFSAMADPSWDLAYAILEHGFSDHEEALLLDCYREVRADRQCPVAHQLALMKARCDAVSALWALEQLQAGRDKAFFEEFALTRIERGLTRLTNL